MAICFKDTTFHLKWFLGGYRVIEFFKKIAIMFFNVILRTYEGIWLGLLERESINKFTEMYYNAKKIYFTDEHNKRGLFLWEKDAVEKYFQGTKTMLLWAAGGGREIFYFEPRQYEVYGFDSNRELIKYGNDFLSRQGLHSRVTFSAPDSCPVIGKKLDCAIISWGAYSHVRGAAKRILLLEQIRENLKPKAPLLVSFWTYNADLDHINSEVIARTANLFKPHEVVEKGDALRYQFTHSFEKAQIEAELSNAGYDPVFYSSEAYGVVVGLVKE